MPQVESRQLRKHYRTNRLRLREKRAAKFARMRAAKEVKRVALLSAEPVMPDLSHCPPLKAVGRRSGFRVTVECLDDGERVSFLTTLVMGELSISPTLAGKKVATVLANYKPNRI